MKNTLGEVKSRVDDTEEWINNLKDTIVEINQTEQQKEKKTIFKNQDSLRDM